MSGRAKRSCLLWLAVLAAGVTGVRGETTGANPGDWLLQLPEAETNNRTLVHRVHFKTAQNPDSYRGYYELNQDYRPCYDQGCPLPDDALQINASRVNDCWIQLAGGVPHDVKWDLEVKVLTNNVVLAPEVDGIVFQVAGRLPGLAVTSGWHRISLEREAGKLTVRVDDTGEAVTFVDPRTRVPLRLTVRREPLVWVRGSALYAAAGEAWPPFQPPTYPAASEAAAWKEVYRQSFDTQESMRDFTREYTNGVVKWLPEDKCMRLSADEGREWADVFATLNMSLTGDLRIRFRGRNIPPEDQFFGVLFACQGDLRREDGYFCEWNRGWMRRIKKADVQRCIVRPHEPENHAAYWADYRIERVGGRIAMYKNNRESISWTDPDPIVNPANGKFAFYVCGQSIDLDDLVIERAGALTNAEAAVTPPPTVAAGAPPRDPTAADTVIVKQSVAAMPSPGGPTPLASPGLTDLRVGDGAVSFRWPAQPGVVYAVETCNSLVNPGQWIPVPGATSLITAAGVLEFSAPTSTHGQSFYRVVARPAAN